MTEQEIEQRIKDEYRKHRNLDWAKIAARKIYASVNYAIKENYDIGHRHGKSVNLSNDHISPAIKPFIDNAH